MNIQDLINLKALGTPMELVLKKPESMRAKHTDYDLILTLELFEAPALPPKRLSLPVEAPKNYLVLERLLEQNGFEFSFLETNVADLLPTASQTREFCGICFKTNFDNASGCMNSSPALNGWACNLMRANA